jgi:hypothetical protein
MDRVSPANLPPPAGPLRVGPMANPPAAEIARQRAAASGGGGGADSIEFSDAARRLAEARELARTETRPAAAATRLVGARLVGARVQQPAFEPAPPARAPDAPLPFYRDPAQANAAATAVAGSRLDVTA